MPEGPGYLIVCVENLLKGVTGPVWPLAHLFVVWECVLWWAEGGQIFLWSKQGWEA